MTARCFTPVSFFMSAGLGNRLMATKTGSLKVKPTLVVALFWFVMSFLAK